MDQFRVDLKWSLWTTDESVWEEYALGILGKMALALEQSGGFTIYTAPRKEIRCGSVTVRKVPEGFHARVEFSEEWDDTSCLLDAFGLEEKDRDYLEEVVPRNDSGDPGVTSIREITAETFEEIFSAIDAVEDDLLKKAESEWKSMESMRSEEDEE